MTYCGKTHYINNVPMVCMREDGHDGLHADLNANIVQRFELQPGEREHLRRFIKYIQTPHAIPEDLTVFESVLSYRTPDEIVDAYVEWLKLGQPE